MIEPRTALFVILASGALIALVRVVMLAMRWRIGKGADIRVLAGLYSLPSRYLRDVHAVVERRPENARMHATLAGGVLLSLLLAVVMATSFGSQLIAIVLILSCTVASYGVWLQSKRRSPKRPANLSGGKWSKLTLAFSLLILSVFLLAILLLLRLPVAGPILWAVTAIGVGAIVWLAWSITDGPMRHAVAGSVHLAYHSRPDRFGAERPDSALRTIDLEAPQLGVENLSDFSWNRLASFDACVQCGRCETACPAFAAGLPLNPKRLIQDLSSNLAAANSALEYSGSPHPHIELPHVSGGPLVSLVGMASNGISEISPDTLWACTTCRACVQECPMMIEHVDAVIDIRRNQTLMHGAVPGKGAEILDNLDKTDTASGRALSERLDWAADLSLPIISEEKPVDVLLWLGETAFDRRNQRTLRALVTLMRQADIDFAVLETELDCGDLARRLGDEAGFQRLASANAQILQNHEFKRIVTIDPHVMHSLRNEYRDFGLALNIEHHTQFLNNLVTTGKLVTSEIDMGRITYHDPCYLARYNGETDASRSLISAISTDFIEMERSAMRSRCCGGGGGAPITDIAGDRRIPDMRMDDARETGANKIITACPYCTQMLEGVSQPRPEIIDIAEALLQATGGARP